MTRMEQIKTAQNEFLLYLKFCTDNKKDATLSGFGTWLLSQILEVHKNWYWYELRLRPMGPGCQPRGFVDHDETKGRHGIIAYDRPLLPSEIYDYDLIPWPAE